MLPAYQVVGESQVNPRQHLQLLDVHKNMCEIRQPEVWLIICRVTTKRQASRQCCNNNLVSKAMTHLLPSALFGSEVAIGTTGRDWWADRQSDTRWDADIDRLSERRTEREAEQSKEIRLPKN